MLNEDVRARADAKEESLFPMRYLGFGFFWAWLYAVGLSPSPIFGSLSCLGGVSFEFVELAIRCVVLLCFIAAARFIATPIGRKVCVALAVAASVTGSACAAFSGDIAFSTVAAALIAVTEVVVFLMWLMFFGTMRTGQVFLLLVASQAVGAALFLAALFLGQTALSVVAFTFPACSLVSLSLSRKLDDAQTDAESNRLEGGSREEEGAVEQEAERFVPTEARTMGRVLGALALYAFAFSLLSSTASSTAGALSLPGFVAEPIDVLALAGVVGLHYLVRNARFETPYALYGIVPVVIGAGFAAFAVVPSIAGVACCLVGWGFVTFQVLALNDSCNIVQRTGETLLRTMAVVRLAISLGLAGGFLAGLLITSVAPVSLVAAIVAIGMFAVLLACAVVFTDRSRSQLQAVANGRIIEEETASRVPKAQAVQAFVEEKGLSRRESEVLEFLLAGRTTVYAADKLSIAESTIRAHVYSIYRKTGIHSRMELMDEFERTWAALDGNPDIDGRG